MNLHELPTPSLILDAQRLRRNTERMSRSIAAKGARLRPHIKTHKCIEVARLATVGHSGAITVSTLAEARAFAQYGFKDITYAVPIEPGKFADAIALLKAGVKLALITDDKEMPDQLNQFAAKAGVVVDLWLEVDTGNHRTGVEPGTPRAREVPHRIQELPALRFAGIITHAGHSYQARTKDELLEVARQERDSMKAFGEELRASDIDVPEISIGSTPTISVIDHLDGIHEVRPGNYVFFDAFQATQGSCSFDDCALTVLAAVIHRDRSRGKVAIDAGAIALSKDRGPVDFESGCGYGRVLDLEGHDLELRVGSISQEHGVLEVMNEATLDTLKVGTRVRIVANHSCLTAAQHSHYNVLEGDEIADVWQIHRGW